MVDQITTLFRTDAYREQLGVVRLEEWPEGIVLWVGGEIRWKSWERTPANSKPTAPLTQAHFGGS